MVLDLTDQADQLLLRAEAEPERVLREAQVLMAHADSATHVVCVAGRAAGIAARQLGDFQQSRQFFDITLAHAEDHPVLAGHAYLSLAGLGAIAGEFDEAFADLDRAQEHLSGAEASHVTAQRAVITHQAGDLDQAAQLYDQAIVESGRHGHRVVEALARSNRAVLALHRSEYHIARSQLEASKALYTELAHGKGLLLIEHNLGYLATCEGRIVDALAHFETFRATSLAFGRPPFEASADRSHALLLAGLTGEALIEGLAAATYFAATGESASESDAWVSAGRAAIAGGDPCAAVGYLQRAMETSGVDRREVWRAIAVVSLASAQLGCAGVRNDGDTTAAQAGLDAAIEVLEAASMTDYAAAARITAARHAVACGDESTSARRLESLIDRPTTLPLDLRSSYWLAIAELRFHRNDIGGTRRAIGAGLRCNQRFRSGLVGLEASSTVGPVGQQLGSLGIATYWASPRRSAWTLLHYMDACHRSVGRANIEYGRDETRTELQTRHQHALSDLDERVRLGAASAQLEAASERLAESERAVAAHDRTQSVVDAAAHGCSVTATRAMVQRCADRTIVELGIARGDAIAVVVAAGRARTYKLGKASDLHDEAAHLRAIVRRRLNRRDGKIELPSTRLDQVLATALGEATRAVVIGPAELSGLPWGALAALKAVDFTVAKSLMAHDQSQGNSAQGDSLHGQLFVAGPGLVGAFSEIRECAELYLPGGVKVLTGAESSTQEVLASLDVDIAHLACHGSVRNDSPLFSSLLMNDGPLHLYELAAAPALPRLIVLSACDVGRRGTSAPTHALGLPDTLVAMGVGCVVASTIAIPDDLAGPLFTRFHKLLLDGHSPSQAIRQLRTESTDPVGMLAASFTVFGS